MGFRLRLRECRPPPSWGRWKHKTVGSNYPTWFTPVLKFIAMLITIRRVVFVLTMELKDSEFSPKQKATLFFVFAAYVCTYLIRVNISIALPLLGEMGMSATKQGILSGSFLWCYAVGNSFSAGSETDFRAKNSFSRGFSARRYAILFSDCLPIRPL